MVDVHFMLKLNDADSLEVASARSELGRRSYYFSITVDDNIRIQRRVQCSIFLLVLSDPASLESETLVLVSAEVDPWRTGERGGYVMEALYP